MLDKLRLKENRKYIVLFVVVLIVLALYTYSSNKTESFADTGTGEGNAAQTEDPMVTIQKMYDNLVSTSKQIEERRVKLSADIAKLEQLSETVEDSGEKQTAMAEQLQKVEDAKEVMKYLEENKAHIASTLEKVGKMEEILSKSTQTQAEVASKLDELKELSANITTQQDSLKSSNVTSLKVGTKLEVGSAKVESSGKITGTELAVPTLGKFTSYASNQPAAGGVEFRHTNKTQGIGLGYNTIYATGTNANQPLGLKARGNEAIKMHSKVNFEHPTNFKSSVANMGTHFPWTDGKNYISGETYLRGGLTRMDKAKVEGTASLRGAKPHHNNPNKRTMLPDTDNINKLRGETHVDGDAHMKGKVNLEHDVNLGKRLYFRDSSMSGTATAHNNSDPYYLEKIHGTPANPQGNSHLRLTLRDDPDESFRIANNDNMNDFKHIFRADGQAEHRGSLKVMNQLCIDDVCVTKDQLRNLGDKPEIQDIFKGSIKCSRGNYIKNFHQATNYIISFRYNQYNSSGTRSVLQFTMSGDDDAGNRMPGIFSLSGGVLEVCANSSKNSKGSTCLNTGTGIPNNAWHDVDIVVVGNKISMYIRFAGQSIHTLVGKKTIGTQRPSGDVEVYVGEGSRAEAFAYVSDLKVYHGSSIQERLKILNTISDSSNLTFKTAGTQLIGDNEQSLVQGKKIGELLQTSNYVFSFDVKPISKTSGWRGILHVTDGQNCCSVGDRYPAIWFFNNSTRLHTRTGYGGTGNGGQDPSDQLPLNVWTRVHIATVGNKFRVFYDYNGAIINKVDKSISGTRPTKWCKVYASAPWYNPANAKIKNVVNYQHDGSAEAVVSELLQNNLHNGLWLRIYEKAGKSTASHFNVTPGENPEYSKVFNKEINSGKISKDLYGSSTEKHYFTAIFTGYLIPSRTATTKLRVGGDDGYRLYVNDQKVIDKWQLQGTTYTESGNLSFTQNVPVKIRLEYFERSGGNTLYLLWKGQQSSYGTFYTIPKANMRYNKFSKDAVHKTRQYPLGNKTWTQAKNYCETQGLSLADKKAVLNEYPSKTGTDTWVPIVDKDNEWLQVGDNRYGKTHTEAHGGVPGWSNTQGTQSYRKNFYCD